MVAAQLAANEFGGVVDGKNIIILSADMQNKPDVAVAIARRWFETEGVDVVADNQLGSAALAVQDLAAPGGKITINVSSATTDLNGSHCSPTGFKLSFDTYSADGAPGPGQNRLTGTVQGGAYLGPHIEYVVDVAGTRLRAFSRVALAPGSEAVLSFAAADCRLVADGINQEAALAG